MIFAYTGHHFVPNDWIVMARKRSLQTDPLIFGASLGFVVLFVAATLAFGDRARAVYADVSGFLMDHFTWMYIGGISAVLVFLIVIFVSRFGNMRLGDDEDEPEYSYPVWFCLLYTSDAADDTASV